MEKMLFFDLKTFIFKVALDFFARQSYNVNGGLVREIRRNI